MVALQSENQGLRADIELLKKNWESIAAKISATSAPSILTPEEEDLYGTASLPALSPASSSASTNGDGDSLFDTNASSSTAPSTSISASASAAQRRVSTRSSTQNTKPNVKKDISPSTGGTFWDSTASPFGGFGGRAMDVHTTFVPELNIGSPAAGLAGKREPLSATVSTYGGNMNPALNGLSDAQLNALREQFVTSSTKSIGKANQNKDNHITDTFFETNPFLFLRNDNLQDYRGQLYAKIANNVAGLQVSQQANKTGLTPPAGLRPAFFSPTSSSYSSSAASFSSSSAAVSSSSSRSSSVIDNMILADADMQATVNIQRVGALATKTLLEKLSSAFWEAFTGDQPAGRPLLASQNRNSTSAVGSSIDGRKVADVVGGKQKLVLVPVSEGSGSSIDGLERELGKLELSK